MRILLATAVAMLVAAGGAAFAEPSVDVEALVQKAREDGRDGVARKTKIVDVRAAKPGEVVVTLIKGEGKETESKPAREGDKVVRNRCPETGGEFYLVPAAKFAERYEGPVGDADPDGWAPYRPIGADVRFVRVRDEDGAFVFTAPWGEPMIARPGDAIVQDLANPKDAYRVQKTAFSCTYKIVRAPER